MELSYRCFLKILSPISSLDPSIYGYAERLGFSKNREDKQTKSSYYYWYWGQSFTKQTVAWIMPSNYVKPIIMARQACSPESTKITTDAETALLSNDPCVHIPQYESPGHKHWPCHHHHHYKCTHCDQHHRHAFGLHHLSDPFSLTFHHYHNCPCM